uniref:Hypothetical secreted peptide n=1 Tax=Rhipicephalus sanguineus TaxID=34632 RepID=C9W1L1_RHISA
MSAVNAAFLLIFAVALTMINMSISRYDRPYGLCRRVGKPCRGPYDAYTCGPACVCEQMYQPFYAYRGYTYTWSCGDPPTWESYYRT